MRRSDPVTFTATGAEQSYVVPETGTYVITAAGAAGGKGNTFSGDYGSVPGKGAQLTAKLLLNAGDELRLVVGTRGTGTTGTAKDGSGGGSGGGTFLFRLIDEITDSRYQFTKGSQNYEVLLVAAGGGGTGDESYRGSRQDGKNGNGSAPYTPEHYIAWGTATRAPSSSGSVTSALSITQYISYDLQGCFYNRNSSRGQGGYGGGSAADDNPSYGGGWYGASYVTYSWSLDPESTGEDGANDADGWVKIEFLPVRLPLDLVTDRAEADVAWIKSRAGAGVAGRTEEDQLQWLYGRLDEYSQVREGFLRGAYNDVDLNRVGAAVELLADWLYDLGYTISVSPKTDWTQADIPTSEQMETYRQNIVTLREAMPMLAGTPPVPDDMDGLTYEEANAIESILLAVEAALTRLEETFFYSAEVYAGEV